MHPRPEFEPTLFLSGAFQTMDSWRVNIIAASYGTPAAYRLAHLWPDRITRIVLGGTMRKIPHHVRDKVQQTVETALKGDRQRLAQQVIDGLLCRDPFLAVQRRGVAERVLRSGLTRMSDAELRQYAWNTTRLLQHAPLDVSQALPGPQALLFTGEHDCCTVPADCMEMAAGFDVVCALLLRLCGKRSWIQSSAAAP